MDKEKLESIELTKFLEKYELKRIQTAATQNILTIIIASLGLMAALAWDEALRHLFENLFGGAGTLPEQLAYAVIITIVAAGVSVWVSKYYKKLK